MPFFDWIADEGGRVVSGVLGGLVMSLFNWEGVWLTVRKIIIGGCMAWALGPTAALLMQGGLSAIGIDGDTGGFYSAASFLVGVFGMVIIETVLRLARKYETENEDKG